MPQAQKINPSNLCSKHEWHFTLLEICPTTLLYDNNWLYWSSATFLLWPSVKNWLFSRCHQQVLHRRFGVEVRILLEQPIHLSAHSRHEHFSFRTEFAHFPNLDLFFLSTKSVQHLKLTHFQVPVSWCWTTCRRHAMGLAHLLVFAAGYRWLPLAAKNRVSFRRPQRWLKSLCSMLRLFLLENSRSECANCWRRRKSWAHNLWAECIQPDGLTASLHAEWHKEPPDASHWQWVRCRRRWRGTKWWKWVRHEECSMKHAVSGWLSGRRAHVQHVPIMSQTTRMCV